MKKLFDLLLILAMGVSLSHCGGIADSKKIAAEEANFKELKWRQLKDALYLSDDIKAPNRLLTEPELEDAYVDTIYEISDKYNETAYAARCAAIDVIKPLPFLNPHRREYKEDGGYEEVAVDATIYQMTYRLQSNKKGDAEEKVRHGLLTVPNKKGSFPVIAYAHGSDAGLSYLSVARDIGAKQEDHISVAPTFQNEPLCRVDTGEPGTIDCDGNGIIEPADDRESNPWFTDIDELLGMHDCVSRYLVKEKLKPITKYDPGFKLLFEAVDFSVDDSVMQYLPVNKIKPIHNFIPFLPPASLLMGTSRGGLVASLALAKAGAAWNGMKSALDAENIELMSLINGTGLLKGLEVIKNALGDKYGIVPPAFNGIATIAGPAAITIGELQLVLEQMIKGNCNETVARKLPGLNRMPDFSKDYLEGRESVDSLKLKVMMRDLSYVGPLMLAPLKKWTKISMKEPLKHGSMLSLHGYQDKVIPFSQAIVWFNLFSNFSNNERIRKLTMNDFGVEVILKAFDSGQEKHKEEYFHVDDGSFFGSRTFIPASIVGDELLESYFKPGAVVNSLGQTEYVVLSSEQIRDYRIDQLFKFLDSLEGEHMGFDAQWDPNIVFAMDGEKKSQKNRENSFLQHDVLRLAVTHELLNGMGAMAKERKIFDEQHRLMNLPHYGNSYGDDNQFTLAGEKKPLEYWRDWVKQVY